MAATGKHSFAFIASLPDHTKDYLMKLKIASDEARLLDARLSHLVSIASQTLGQISTFCSCRPSQSFPQSICFHFLGRASYRRTRQGVHVAWPTAFKRTIACERDVVIALDLLKQPGRSFVAPHQRTLSSAVTEGA